MARFLEKKRVTCVISGEVHQPSTNASPAAVLPPSKARAYTLLSQTSASALSSSSGFPTSAMIRPFSLSKKYPSVAWLRTFTSIERSRATFFEVLDS